MPGIVAFAEQRGGEIAPSTFEVLGEARRLAETSKTPVTAVLLGQNLQDKAKSLIAAGADRVAVYDDASLASFLEDSYAKVLVSFLEEEKPDVVLAAATFIGRSLMPRVAARLDTGLAADCTQLTWNNGLLEATRPAYGGNMLCAIVNKTKKPQMATLRPKVFAPLAKDAGRQGEIVSKTAKPEALQSALKFVQSQKDAGSTVNLGDADIIVSGGRGLGKPEGFELIREFANALGGAVGASRAAVDSGWIPYAHQVGLTGRTVRPKVYFACGISGAVQHLAGMGSSDTIVALNKDPECAMMKLATYGLEGDLYELIPLIIQEVKKLRGS